MKVPIDGGATRRVTDLSIAGLFDVSPDGSTVAFTTMDHAGGHEEKLVLVATDAGKVRQMMKFERETDGRRIRFSPDGKALAYTIRENGVDNLW